MARYRKLDLRTWSDQKFRELTPLQPSGQALWLFLILGPQTTNIPGLFEASEVALADRLGWTLEAFREAFREACSKGMAKADWKARLVWLPKAPEYNRPESPNVVISWGSVFDELPECNIKHEAYQSLKAFAKGLGEPFEKAFTKAFAEPSRKAMPNQKQEQEQEQKQEQEHIQSANARKNTRVNGSETGASSEKPRDLDASSEIDLSETEHHERFEELKRAYPKFPGRQDWITVEHYCRQLIETGQATWEDLIAAARRYAKYCAAGGVSEPKYILTPAKFFSGADKPWTQPWDPPEGKPQHDEQAITAAWTRVVDHVRNGRYRSTERNGLVGDERIDTIIKELGGYVALGRGTDSDLRFTEMRFRKLWREGAPGERMQ